MSAAAGFAMPLIFARHLSGRFNAEKRRVRPKIRAVTGDVSALVRLLVIVQTRPGVPPVHRDRRRRPGRGPSAVAHRNIRRSGHLSLTRPQPPVEASSSRPEPTASRAAAAGPSLKYASCRRPRRRRRRGAAPRPPAWPHGATRRARGAAPVRAAPRRPSRPRRGPRAGARRGMARSGAGLSSAWRSLLILSSVRAARARTTRAELPRRWPRSASAPRRRARAGPVPPRPSARGRRRADQRGDDVARPPRTSKRTRPPGTWDPSAPTAHLFATSTMRSAVASNTSAAVRGLRSAALRPRSRR